MSKVHSFDDLMLRLNQLNDELRLVNRRSEIVIVGGSALMAWVSNMRATSDIDYFGEVGVDKEILELLGFSDNVKFIFSLNDIPNVALVRLQEFSNLSVSVLSMDDIAVMKLFSSRIGDWEDLVQYILPKVSSLSMVWEKSLRVKLHRFDGDNPLIHVNNWGSLLHDLQRKNRDSLFVASKYEKVSDFLKSHRLYRKFCSIWRSRGLSIDTVSSISLLEACELGFATMVQDVTGKRLLIF